MWLIILQLSPSVNGFAYFNTLPCMQCTYTTAESLCDVLCLDLGWYATQPWPAKELCKIILYFVTLLPVSSYAILPTYTTHTHTHTLARIDSPPEQNSLTRYSERRGRVCLLQSQLGHAALASLLLPFSRLSYPILYSAEH